MLTPTTIVLAEGFMGIEAQLPFYLSEGENGLKTIRSEMIFQGQWGFEEARHKPTLALVLDHSGARTADEVAEYNAKVLQHGWSASEHPGLDNCLGARIYVINLQLVQIHLKYFPEETEEKIHQVLEGFKMPALNLLPNSREFVRALHRVEPTLKALTLAA